MNMRACLLIAALVGWTMPAAAEPVQVPSSKARPSADPNQKICQDITVVGSRLATKRICATREEWAQQRRDDRDTVDQIQRSPCVRDTSGQCQH
jgi:hypothetical protein